MLMKTDTLQDSLDQYRAKIAGRRVIALPPTSSPWLAIALQTGRPDQLLHQGYAEEGSRLRSCQTSERFRSAEPRRKRRLLCG